MEYFFFYIDRDIWKEGKIFMKIKKWKKIKEEKNLF